MEIPIWVKPQAEGNTPMAEAMNKAVCLIETWRQRSPDSLPPIVINITDGAPDDYKDGAAPATKKAAEHLLEMSTTHGQLLLFNAHISSSGMETSEIQFPNYRDLIHDPYAQWLFDISSVLPVPLFESANKVGFSLRVGARCLVFNSRPETLINLLTFGS